MEIWDKAISIHSAQNATTIPDTPRLSTIQKNKSLLKGLKKTQVKPLKKLSGG